MNTSTTTPLLVLGTALALVTLSGCGGPPADQHTDSRDHHATASAPDPSTPPKGSAEAGDLVIEDAWLAEPANPSMTAGYLTISNTGDEDITLTEAATSLSDRTELHTVETTESGAAQMVPVDTSPSPRAGPSNSPPADSTSWCWTCPAPRRSATPPPSP